MVHADHSVLRSADVDTLRLLVRDLSARVNALEVETAALEYAAGTCGALADRLNDALRTRGNS